VPNSPKIHKQRENHEKKEVCTREIISSDPYRDLYNLHPPRLPHHPPMSRTARAAQFMPFKALEPHEANIQAVEEIIEQKTDTYIEFDEIYPDF
jgi:hypothetical protein